MRWRAPRFAEFEQDARECNSSAKEGETKEAQLSPNDERNFIKSWLERRVDAAQNNEQFVNFLLTNAALRVSDAERAAIIKRLDDGAATRAEVLRATVENQSVYLNNFDEAFILMHYFIYLQRNPDAPPDRDMSGYNFWLRWLKDTRGYLRLGEVFRNSAEYRAKSLQAAE